MKNAPRTIAVIGSVALIAIALAIGYFVALPDALRAPSDRSETASAVRTALAKPNELESAADLAPMLASVDAGNLDATVGEYEAAFAGMGPGAAAMELLAEAWSKIDAASALQRIRGWEPNQRNLALPFLMRSWARRDLASARAAVETIEPAELRDTAAAAVILGWADSADPAIWDAYVAGLPFGSNAAYDLMWRIGAREGIDGLLRRAESVPEDAADGFRRLALRHAVDIAAQIDPERAAAFAEQHGASVGDLERLVARRWAENDGLRATQWALSRPTGHDKSLRAAFESWLSSERQAAMDWAQQQPEEVVVRVLDLYMPALGKTDPKRALEISAGIADPAQRRQTQLQLARNWLAQQPEIAASWLEQNGLADLVAEIRPRPKPKPFPSPPMGQPGAKVE